eukprot:6193282-Pleurochrysis_carterae.AAC.1
MGLYTSYSQNDGNSSNQGRVRPAYHFMVANQLLGNLATTSGLTIAYPCYLLAVTVVATVDSTIKVPAAGSLSWREAWES